MTSPQTPAKVYDANVEKLARLEGEIEALQASIDKCNSELKK